MKRNYSPLMTLFDDDEVYAEEALFKFYFKVIPFDDSRFADGFVRCFCIFEVVQSALVVLEGSEKEIY